jgi:putative transposase
LFNLEFSAVQYIDGKQIRHMKKYAGYCRYVYNRGLALQQALYERGESRLGYAGLCKMLTTWKSESHSIWLQEAPSQVLQQCLKDLERSYTNFFAKRAFFPKFKKKGRSFDSFRFPDSKGFKFDQINARVCLPKLGWIRYCKSREILGDLRNITVSSKTGNGISPFKRSAKLKTSSSILI